VVNHTEFVLNNARARLSFQKLKRHGFVQSAAWLAKPAMRLCWISENTLGFFHNSSQAQSSVRLDRRKPFILVPAPGKCAPGCDDLVYLVVGEAVFRQSVQLVGHQHRTGKYKNNGHLSPPCHLPQNLCANGTNCNHPLFLNRPPLYPAHVLDAHHTNYAPGFAQLRLRPASGCFRSQNFTRDEI
jgi:hypothetical protein